MLHKIVFLVCFINVFGHAQEVVITSLCGRTLQVQTALMEKFKERRPDCSQVTDEDLKAVVFLDLNNKGITSLKAGDFSGLFYLEILRLKGNNLRTLPVGVFSRLFSLDTLDLSENQLSRLPSEGLFASLASLRRLSLYKNQLRSLSPGVFLGLSSLNLLILGKNQLQSLPGNLFSSSPFLKDIFIDNNQLSSLPPGLFSGFSLEQLELSGNPFSKEERSRIQKEVKAKLLVF